MSKWGNPKSEWGDGVSKWGNPKSEWGNDESKWGEWSVECRMISVE